MKRSTPRHAAVQPDDFLTAVLLKLVRFGIRLRQKMGYGEQERTKKDVAVCVCGRIVEFKHTQDRSKQFLYLI